MWYIIDGKDLKPEDQLVSVKDLNTRIAELEVEVSNDYVAKEEGKGLSSNDYTYNEKTKLSGIEDDAEVNVQVDWNQDDSTKDDFIKNKPINFGTITSIKMNGTTVSTGGEADLGTVITSHQDISGKEDKTNKVTSLPSQSTDTQYPSAKCVYDMLGNINTILATLVTVGGNE